jgi:hypothetical protein
MKGSRMRTLRLLGLIVGIALALAAAIPAAAKGFIAEANISGPGLGVGSIGGGTMRLEAPEADGMWESGVLDDRKEDSLSALGLARTDLGPRYLVTYRFEFGPGARGQVIQQELYPYAKGGTVTYTPPGQKQTGEEDLTGMGMSMPLPAGWFRTNSGFFRFLVEHGFPATNPVAPANEPAPRNQPASEAMPTAQPVPWAWVVIGIVGFAALTLGLPGVRRRVLPTATRVTH